MIYKNPHAPNWSLAQKYRKYLLDNKNGALAYKSDNTQVPLNTVSVNDTEYIAGLWRVQNKLDFTISNIRDKQLILGPRIDIQEKNYFEYYQAAKIPVYNCYGPINPLIYDMIVAKYATDGGVYWSYGKTIADARAFLGIKMYDEFMDVIHRAACKNIICNTK